MAGSESLGKLQFKTTSMTSDHGSSVVEIYSFTEQYHNIKPMLPIQSQFQLLIYVTNDLYRLFNPLFIIHDNINALMAAVVVPFDDH